MKQLSIALASIILMSIFPACSDNNSGTEPAADAIEALVLSVVPSSASIEADAVIPFTSNNSDFEYRYDAEAGSLYVRHLNAAFRKGVGNITVRVSLEENIITLVESQSGASSEYLGLYDLEFVISNLPLRVYRVVVIEPYLRKNERPLSFRMDLVESLNGSRSVEREQSPWGEMASF